MTKNFTKWTVEKTDLEEKEERQLFAERQIWFASIGLNIGFEQDGRGEKHSRPVMILKKFTNEIFWCLPLTKSQKTGKYYFPIELNDGISNVILSQLKLADAKRLQYKIGNVSSNDFESIKEKLRQFLA
jgi:mRNA-degrading endonuclease toxin of MazEF toxin-antitoxin module